VKILVLTDRFHPEITAPSVRILDHARLWVERGHEVTVVTCAPNFPRGELFPGYRNRIYQEEWIEGIRVVRIVTYMTANEGFVLRSIDYASYMLAATALSPRFPDFDVILASSPPIFTAVAGYLVSRIRRRPWVFEIRDLWPASIEAVGAGGGRLVRALERLELFLYRRADRIVSLTRSFKEDLTRRGIPPEKNDVVMNGVDTSRFGPEQVRFDARAELGLPPDAFVAGYLGTIGMAHGLATLLDAAERCAGRDDMHFLIMGEGAERAALEAAARGRGLKRVQFRDFAPHQDVPSWLAALDASIVHLRPNPLFRTVIPSKIFEAMAMGVPILMAVEGESAAIVAEAEAGLCIPSGDPEAMCRALDRLASDPGLRRRLGRNGRAAAEQKFSRRANAEAALLSLRAAMAAAGGPS
jgi:putative colanic acid biosynthesis glycosyltransferase WcaI